MRAQLACPHTPHCTRNEQTSTPLAGWIIAPAAAHSTATHSAGCGLLRLGFLRPVAASRSHCQETRGAHRAVRLFLASSSTHCAVHAPNLCHRHRAAGSTTHMLLWTAHWPHVSISECHACMIYTRLAAEAGFLQPPRERSLVRTASTTSTPHACSSSCSRQARLTVQQEKQLKAAYDAADTQTTHPKPSKQKA